MNEHAKIEGRGRKRDEKVHNTVLDATCALLCEVGYKKLSIEKISKHSRVSKVTIYKWWESLPHLVLEVMNTRYHEEKKMPDTGTLEGDLYMYAKRGVEKMHPRKQEIMRSLMAEAQINPSFKKYFNETVINRSEQLLLTMLTRAKKRGEIRASLRLKFISDVCWGYFWYAVLEDKKFSPKEFVSFVVRTVT